MNNKKQLFGMLAIALAFVFTACGGGGTGGGAAGCPTTDEGVVIGGIRWATRNVDAPGTFAARPQDAGMFYQWNSRVGWSSSDPMVNTNGDNTWESPTITNRDRDRDRAWISENDPCPPGWRVPTRREVVNSHRTGTWTTNWNGTRVSGYVLGTAPNQIFLPAVGFRTYNTGALMGRGEVGSIWTSSEMTATRAGNFVFYDGRFNQRDIQKSSGLSVRCVQDVE